jgi:hypothetical protein
MAVRLSALCAGRPLHPGRFLVLISVRGWVDPRSIVRLEGLGKLKNPVTFGNRTRDLPAWSIVPQPATLPRKIVIQIKRRKWCWIGHSLWRATGSIQKSALDRNTQGGSKARPSQKKDLEEDGRGRRHGRRLKELLSTGSGGSVTQLPSAPVGATGIN